MFAVKKLGKNGIWGTVSLIDKNGSFRGEAKFETRKEAEEYRIVYERRMKKPVDVKVFDDSSDPESLPSGSKKN